MSRPLLTCALALAATLSASADPVLELMRAAAPDGPVYAYEMTFSGDGITASGKLDPSQPEGQRLDLYSPDDASFSDEFKEGLEDMDREADGDIWCKDFADMVPGNAAATTETATSRTYTFTPQPEADADRTEQKMMKKLNGTITLDKADGAILAFNMHLPKPYKPAMVAKVNRFQLAASCDRAPDGRTYMKSFEFDISGSAMMQSFEQSISRRITRLLDPVG